MLSYQRSSFHRDERTFIIFPESSGGHGFAPCRRSFPSREKGFELAWNAMMVCWCPAGCWQSFRTQSESCIILNFRESTQLKHTNRWFLTCYHLMQHRVVNHRDISDINSIRIVKQKYKGSRRHAEIIFNQFSTSPNRPMFSNGLVLITIVTNKAALNFFKSFSMITWAHEHCGQLITLFNFFWSWWKSFP